MCDGDDGGRPEASPDAAVVNNNIIHTGVLDFDRL